VSDRLRTPPAERFAGLKHLFSLGEALKQLRAEDHPARDGHRQVTIFHRAPVTKVLFSFDPGGQLQEHSARGLVTIHALEGRLEVAAGGVEHQLEAGSILILDPDVLHDVRASERSAMLLTVHLQKTGTEDEDGR
jgi:quercetin dioxygenase-like cupin family protein